MMLSCSGGSLRVLRLVLRCAALFCCCRDFADSFCSYFTLRMPENAVCNVMEMIFGSILVRATVVFPAVTIDITFPTNETTGEGSMTPSELEAVLRTDPSSLFSEEFIVTFGEPDNVTEIVTVYPSPPPSPPVPSSPPSPPPPAAPPAAPPVPPPAPTPEPTPPYPIMITVTYDAELPGPFSPGRKLLQKQQQPQPQQQLLATDSELVGAFEDAVDGFFTAPNVYARNVAVWVRRDLETVKIYAEIITPNQDQLERSVGPAQLLSSTSPSLLAPAELSCIPECHSSAASLLPLNPLSTPSLRGIPSPTQARQSAAGRRQRRQTLPGGVSVG